MGLTDLARQHAASNGSLRGTLSDVGGEPQVSGTGFSDPLAGTTGSAPFSPGAPDLGGMSLQGSPVSPTRQGAFPVAVGLQHEAEQGLGELLAGKLGVLGKPVKLVVDLFAHLDRPQQFVFAAITRGLESDSAMEGLKSGSTAFLFRRPDGMMRPKDRVDVNEVIDVVGEEFFGTKNAAEKMPLVPRLATQLSAILLLDPLIWFPSTWISKAGSSLTKYSESVRSTYAMQLALTKSPLHNAKSGAAIVNDMRVEKYLMDAGRRVEGSPTVFDMIIEPVRANLGKLDDAEFGMIEDLITGLGVESAVFRDLVELKRRGIVDEDTIASVLGKLTKEITQPDAEEFAGLIERAILTRRQSPALVKKMIIRGPKSTKDGKHARVITLEDPDAFGDKLLRPFITGQLVNRLGLMPSHAVDVRAARAFASGIRKGVGSGKVKPVAADKFYEAISETAPKVAFPKAMGKNFEDAMRAAVGTGRFVVDSTVAAKLEQQFEAVGYNLEVGKRMARVLAGVEKPFVGSDVPSEIAYREVVNGMMDSDDAGVRALNVISLLFDPKSALPKPIHSTLKYAEDIKMAHDNAIFEMVHEMLTYRGKVLQSGSYEMSLLGLSLTGTTKAAAKFQMHKGLRGVSAEEARALVAKDPDLQKIHDGARLFFVGSKEGLIRRGSRGWEVLKDDAPLEHYFPRMYPNLREKINRDVAAGRISSTEGRKTLARMEEAGEDAISPLEMEYVDRSSVWFSHFKRRTSPDEIAEFSTDLGDALRAFIPAFTRKMYVEPAIATANAAAARGAGLPRTQKEYLRLLLQRMLGYRILEEELLDNTINVVRSKFGFAPKIRPATKVSLWITRNFYRGMLGMNTGFFLKNLTQGINTAAQAGPLNVWRGAAMYVTNPILPNGKAWRTMVKERNLMRNTNDFLEKGIAPFGKKKAVMAMDKVLFSPAHFSENWNRGVAMGAGLNQEMRRAGYTSIREFFTEAPEKFARAIEYGHGVANETQFMYGVVGRSPLAGSPIGRMGLQFFSWPVKQVEFLSQGWKDEGAMFFMRYVAMSGLVSKVAEHAEVDASAFLGFGFWPTGMSPSAQLIGNLYSAVEAQAVEGDSDASERHFRDFVKNVETLIPAFLQIQKMASALGEIDEGVQRGFRDRFSRRTDDPGRDQELSQVLDETLNPLIQKLNMPWLNRSVSGEQFIKLLGLPGVKRNKFRDLTQKLNKESRAEDLKARKLIDRYVKAYGQGDFVGAQEVIQDARSAGIPISASMIKNELHNRQTPSMDRILENARRASKSRLLQTLEDEAPELAAQVRTPIPFDPLGGTRQ